MFEQASTPESSGSHMLISRRHLPRWTLMLGLTLLVAVGFSACLERLSSSLGLRCESDADCWDNLTCKNELCGGERRRPEPKATETTAEGDGGTADTTEPPTERTAPPESSTDKLTDAGGKETTPGESVSEQTSSEGRACKGNVNSQGACAQDSDCCSGQTCKDVDLSGFGGPKTKFCAECTQDADCPQGTVCCTQAKPILGFSFCAPRCSA